MLRMPNFCSRPEAVYRILKGASKRSANAKDSAVLACAIKALVAVDSMARTVRQPVEH
jgi:hypothetical protein